jgi:hypothetical protein
METFKLVELTQEQSSNLAETVLRWKNVKEYVGSNTDIAINLYYDTIYKRYTVRVKVKKSPGLLFNVAKANLNKVFVA